jgi:hypothetical protein
MGFSLLGIMAIPAVLALVSAWGAVMLFYVQMNKPLMMRIFIWICIVVLAGFALAIGSCFAMFIGGGGMGISGGSSHSKPQGVWPYRCSATSIPAAS